MGAGGAGSGGEDRVRGTPRSASLSVERVLNGFAVGSGVEYYPMRAKNMNPNLQRREVF